MATCNDCPCYGENALGEAHTHRRVCTFTPPESIANLLHSTVYDMPWAETHPDHSCSLVGLLISQSVDRL
jgi:hypothetical protein